MIVTVASASAVPSNVGVVSFVMSSEFDTQLSEDEFMSGVLG